MVGQKVREDDDKGSSYRHQGVLELLGCSGVGGMNEVRSVTRSKQVYIE
jgi:hypothetical protein